jgi:H-type lectin domain
VPFAYGDLVMSEFFRWLSANPLATTFLLVAFALVMITFVLAVFITVGAIVRGEEIQIAGVRFGKPSDRWMVLTGTVDLPEVDLDGKKKQSFYETDYQGDRTLRLRIRFDRPFKREPKIAVSLRKIDLGPPDIKRLEVYAEDPKQDGFELFFKTSHGSTVFNAAATWTAVGEI